MLQPLATICIFLCLANGHQSSLSTKPDTKMNNPGKLETPSTKSDMGKTLIVVDAYVQVVEQYAFPTNTKPREKIISLVSAFPTLVQRANKCALTLRPIISVRDDSIRDNQTLIQAAERLSQISEKLSTMDDDIAPPQMRFRRDAVTSPPVSYEDEAFVLKWKDEVETRLTYLGEIANRWLRLTFSSGSTEEIVRVCSDDEFGPHGIAMTVKDMYLNYARLWITHRHDTDGLYSKLHAYTIIMTFYQGLCSAASEVTDNLGVFDKVVAGFLSEADSHIQKLMLDFENGGHVSPAVESVAPVTQQEEQSKMSTVMNEQQTNNKNVNSTAQQEHSDIVSSVSVTGSASTNGNGSSNGAFSHHDQIRTQRKTLLIATHRHMIGSYMAEYMWRVSLDKDADIFEEILKAIKEYWPPGKAVRELTYYEKMNENGDFDDDNDVSSDEE